MSFSNKVAILGSSRTPFVKSQTHYLGKSNQDMLGAALADLIHKTKIEGELLGDFIAGAIMNHPLDWNLSRETVLGSALSPETPGLTIQRACGTGLEAVNLIALKIASGQITAGIGGGSDTNSDIPLFGQRKLTHFLIKLQQAKGIREKLAALKDFRLGMLKPQVPEVREPRTGLSMGEHCELMVKEWQISRRDQDELAYRSHQNAAKAYDEGFYDDLIIPFASLSRDTITRKDSSLEKLASLKPAFDKTDKGSLTAGNSTPLTDGASVVLLGSPEWGKKHQLEPLAYFTDCEVAAVDFVHGAGLLMAPTIAVARLLARNQLSLQDFDYYEIHEAFAGQVLCTLKAWESAAYCQRALHLKKPLGSIDVQKMNIKGGSLALGHPFAATGGRLVGAAAKILAQKGKGRILISVCTAGGMGVAAIIER
ncbi:acetyl-CoA C-acetyltransferase [Fluoribacter dumoffii]|uniref:acetyl-CoA C-acetyltransferase n=1 Tax=Fluoribacter dumoffii TaxID=463 RepID=UPI002242D011|nr:acetyl-CoA C-acetyltransferase [Fluoribacter dumoffii]MCW8417065.1 acetyl-CoA C-acetyltransferase [Fluoribacter dumoffii]MCW8455095.1 acetyl-CoA C-acetyltransferase [Fluoribacter dumoffii]MCW8460828.1 acetyl-CoA C-acetyltransferase [Fluoribacter dumoffii]MCW8484270.1 acetyl-CoA C-acetyltransferase [Fluoribacter dumoffii]